MIRRGLRFWMLALVAIPLAAMLLVIVVGAFLQVQTRVAGELTGKSDVAMLETQELLASTLDAEAGMHAYVLTENPRFLDRYTAARREIPAVAARLQALAANDRQRAPMIARLRRSAEARLAESGAAVDSVRAHHRAAAIAWVASGVGKLHMDEFRAEISSYQRFEIVERAGDLARLDAIWNVGLCLLAGAVLAAIVALVFDAVFARAIVRRLSNLAVNAERVGRGEALVPAPDGTDEIAHVALAFQYMADELEVRQGALARYRLLTEVTSDIIVFTDRTSLIILEANAAALRAYGRTREQLVGQPIFVLHDPDHPILLDLIEATDSEDGVQFEAVHRRLDGVVFPVEVRSRTAEIEGRRVIISTNRDVTERQRVREELVAAMDQALEGSRLKGEFVATMSHEIRTPMNGVIGMSELLLRTELDADQSEYASTIKDSAYSLLAVINDILDFSKIEAGKLVVERVDFDLRHAIEGVCSLLRPSAESKGIELRLELSNQLTEIARGDPGRLRQVLMNLIGNAVKFTERGSVDVVANVVAVRDEDVVLEVIVRDTGIGIPAASLAGLFEPFVQGDGTATRRYGGTGLGLSISRRLVELMGGRIEVESREGVGSTFRFTARCEAAQLARSGVTDGVLAGARILVVEDDVTASRTARHYLDAWGVEVESADDVTSGLAALERAEAEQRPFDLALVDFVLPARNGFALARAVRSDGRFGVPALILTTAFDAAGRREAALSAGFDAFLLKPCRPSDLHNVLLTLMATRVRVLSHLAPAVPAPARASPSA